MKDFMDFIREQGVVGLAVGFILGGAVSQLVEALVAGIINPLIAAVFDTSSLSSYTAEVGDAVISWGAVVAVAINFVVIAAVVYWGVKGLKLDKADKKSK